MQGEGPNNERRVLAQFEHWLEGLCQTELNAVEEGMEAPAEDLIERILGSLECGIADGRAFLRYTDRGHPSPIGPLMVLLGKEGAVVAGALLPISETEDREQSLRDRALAGGSRAGSGRSEASQGRVRFGGASVARPGRDTRRRRSGPAAARSGCSRALARP